MIKAYIGKMRSGKTLAMTMEVVRLLNQGRVVYVNYRVNWNPDAPMSPVRRLFHRLGFKKKRYPATNLRLFREWSDIQNVANCTVALDEGWQYFDSYNKLPIEKRMRLYQSGKWELDFLYTVQRYMMTDINLRWSTSEFWESTLYKIPFVSYPLIIYRLYDLDEDGESAKLARKGIDEKGTVVDLSLSRKWFFTRQKHFDLYDTKEDIYSTEHYRNALQEKVNAGGDGTNWNYDPLPTIWSILGKYVYKKPKRTHDVRRTSQAKAGFGKVITSPVVARIYSRNNTLNNAVVDINGIRTIEHANRHKERVEHKISRV